jgi:hypothetical protein
MGMAMKIADKHKSTTPMVVAAAGSLLPKTSISALGIIAASTEIAPKHNPNSPGHPHNKAVAMVAISPEVRLSILHSPL